ncbi:ZEAMMB73_Zm00001d034581 [Fagus crenata]
MEKVVKVEEEMLKMKSVLSNLKRNKSNARDKGIGESQHSSFLSPKSIPLLSPLANSVVSRCSKILQVPTEELQHQFDTELPGTVKELLTYARSFLEFCSYQTIHLLSTSPDFLSDKEFRRLTYDMMLAWEAPSVESETLDKESPSCSNQEVEDEDGWSLFYSSSTTTAVQVDDKKTVGREAFARIAPVCAAVADIITVHNLFDALTSSSDYQLHFLVYEKYIRSLDKIIKAAKYALAPAIGNLQLSEGEIVIDVDGIVPTQPVLQHIGISAWPGRLTLTNYALYFETGVGLYDKAVRYDLAMDMKQVIKPELTGPLGARLFDKAVMYKSTSIEEPVYLEFPQFKGNSRRDYWLDICLEILHAHRFIRKNNLKEIQKSEILAKAILGIFRYHAVREAFNFFSSHYKTLLAFNLAESLPGGDKILETLSSRLALLNVGAGIANAKRQPTLSPRKQQPTLSPVSLLTLSRLGFVLQKEANLDGESVVIGDICVGETNPLELAVKQSVLDTGTAEAAQATVDQVKVDGIDTNVAVMKELLFPVIELVSRLQRLASWEDPYKSTVFLVMTGYTIIRGWTRYILPTIFVFVAILMLWCRHFNKGRPLEAFKVTPPPNRNAVEQLLTLQDAITQFEALIQAGNIILLKIRALLFAVLPQATDKVVLLLVFIAAAFAFVPLKYLVLLVFLEAFTREMPYRKESSNRWVRRVKEWWIRIPAAPVQLIKVDEKKKKK